MMKILKTLGYITAASILFSLYSNWHVIRTSKNKTYSNVSSIPKNKVGLVLGAGKYRTDGGINLYYQHRVNAAIALYNAGKIDIILVSGDHGRVDYNEPLDFKTDLLLEGIPEEKIVLDYAGFRTLDSIIRAKEVFDLDSFTIISQKFHNERAIFLAKSKDLNVIAFNAQDVYGSNSIRTTAREYLAKTKATFDIAFNVQPKFLGDKIKIN